MAQAKNGHEKMKSALKPPPTGIKDARELLAAQPKKQSSSPNNNFGDNPPVIDTQSTSTLKKMANPAAQTEEITMAAATQTERSIKLHETDEYCLRRVDPTQCSQKELVPNIGPPSMTNKQQTQLKASHKLITERIIATIDQGMTN